MKLSWILLAGCLGPTLSAQQPLRTVLGEGSNGLPGFGHAVASAGDVDLDGFDDFVVGAPYENSCGEIAGGRVKLFSGITGTLLLPALEDCDEPLRHPYYGFDVAGVGDVDGDGHPDVAIGAPYIPGVSSPRPGMAEIRSGLDGAVVHETSGDAPGDMFGTSVSGAGDVDLDGVPDWAVGATQYDGTQYGPGYVRLFSGATGAPIRTLSGTPRYGSSLVSAGDVNLDGYPDLLVGARTDRGRVVMHSGANGALLWSRPGDTAISAFGAAVDRAGDVDADGLPDVVVGAIGTSQASLLRALDGAFLFDVLGPPLDWFGGSVAGLGDIDLDGHDDFAVGARSADVPGATNAGAVWAYSGRTHEILRRFTGSATGERFGFALAAVGDLDQDGVRDLAVGATEELNGGPGFVDVYSARKRWQGGRIHPAALRSR